jgi:hypothetical protein
LVPNTAGSPLNNSMPIDQYLIRIHNRQRYFLPPSPNPSRSESVG